MTEFAFALAGLGFGLFGGFYLGQRGGLTFVKKQLELAGVAAEKMAQVLVAPWGNRPVDEAPPQDAAMTLDDLMGDTERVPSWMEDESRSDV